MLKISSFDNGLAKWIYFSKVLLGIEFLKSICSDFVIGETLISFSSLNNFEDSF